MWRVVNMSKGNLIILGVVLGLVPLLLQQLFSFFHKRAVQKITVDNGVDYFSVRQIREIELDTNYDHA